MESQRCSSYIYNKNILVFDTMDQLATLYSFLCKSVKWWQKVMFLLLLVSFIFRTYFMNLPRNKLRVVMNVVERLVLDGTIPTHILVLVKDLMAFRLKINVAGKPENSKREY